MPRAEYAPLGPADFETFDTWSGGGFVWHDGARASPSANRWGESMNGRTYWYASIRHRTLGVPWWFLAFLFAVMPGRAAWRWLKRRRFGPNQCQACGYDLRATPDASGPLLLKCPECGHATVGPCRERKQLTTFSE